MRLTRRALLWGLPGLLGVACLSPTLPLPPPSPPDQALVSEGEYRLTGVIPFAGTVLVMDRRTSLVYGKVVEDVYTLDVGAQPGDPMVVWYESGQDVSDLTEFNIEENAAPLEPPDGGSGSVSDAASDATPD